MTAMGAGSGRLARIGGARWLLALLGAATLAIPAAGAPPQSGSTAALEARIAALENRITLQEDVEQVRRVAFSYGYYMDNALYKQVTDMFSPNIVSCEISGYGVFNGPSGCRRMWFDVMGPYYGGNRNQLDFGRLVKHYLIKDVITIAPDGRHASGRFDYLGFLGVFGKPEFTANQIGVYNIDFVKEGGVWRIGKFMLTFDTINYNQRDWAANPQMRCPLAGSKPDGPSTFHHEFPETGVVPFSYSNPVTGAVVPSVVTSQRYWTGNWPGEFGGPCGKRADAATGK